MKKNLVVGKKESGEKPGHRCSVILLSLPPVFRPSSFSPPPLTPYPARILTIRKEKEEAEAQRL